MASTIPGASLTAGGAVATGATVDFLTAKKTVTAVIAPSATLTDGVVVIEAAQETAHWVVLRVIGVADTESCHTSLEGVAFRYWRASVIQAVVGGTVRVTFMEAD